jgi:hypothetical protein
MLDVVYAKQYYDAPGLDSGDVSGLQAHVIHHRCFSISTFVSAQPSRVTSAAPSFLIQHSICSTAFDSLTIFRRRPSLLRFYIRHAHRNSIPTAFPYLGLPIRIRIRILVSLYSRSTIYQFAFHIPESDLQSCVLDFGPRSLIFGFADLHRVFIFCLD